MLTIGDFNSFGVFLGHPVLSYYRVSKKKTDALSNSN